MDHAHGYFRSPDESRTPSKTITTMRGIIRVMIEVCGGIAVEEFGVAELKACRDRIMQNGLKKTDPEQGYDRCGRKPGDQYGRRYVNDCISRLKSVIKWGVSEGKVEPHVYHRIQYSGSTKMHRDGRVAERAPVGPADPWSIIVAARYLPPELRTMVRVALRTGARRSELAGMRWMDIDTKSEPWVFSPSSHKTQMLGKRRVIVLGPRAKRLLERMMHTGVSPSISVFINSKGKPYLPNRIGVLLKQAIDAAIADGHHIERWTMHQLRHTHLTVVRREIGLDHAQASADHSDVKVTQRYAAPDDSLKVDVANRVG